MRSKLISLLLLFPYAANVGAQSPADKSQTSEEQLKTIANQILSSLNDTELGRVIDIGEPRHPDKQCWYHGFSLTLQRGGN